MMDSEINGIVLFMPLTPAVSDVPTDGRTTDCAKRTATGQHSTGNATNSCTRCGTLLTVCHTCTATQAD